NPVRQADLVVNWSQDKGTDVTLSATTSKTDATGKATITLTSTKKPWMMSASVRSTQVPPKWMRIS
ncbi:Ig-like domain-containing protein, partial [Morganella morganii]|uniref:Ig-like domain-containing protein n=1 Tax=Morganella morganii TaxID=582 RepID=UPI001269B675